MKCGDRVIVPIRVNGSERLDRGQVVAVNHGQVVAVNHGQVEVKLEDGRVVQPFASQVKREVSE